MQTKSFHEFISTGIEDWLYEGNVIKRFSVYAGSRYSESITACKVRPSNRHVPLHQNLTPVQKHPKALFTDHLDRNIYNDTCGSVYGSHLLTYTAPIDKEDGTCGFLKMEPQTRIFWRHARNLCSMDWQDVRFYQGRSCHHMSHCFQRFIYTYFPPPP